jgi:predicted DNA-binding transcriptional regulator AlpA
MTVQYAPGAIPPATREIRDMAWVSERTGVPLSTLRHYRLNGIGPRSFKLGRRVMYAVEDVDAWIEAARNA